MSLDDSLNKMSLIRRNYDKYKEFPEVQERMREKYCELLHHAIDKQSMNILISEYGMAFCGDIIFNNIPLGVEFQSWYRIVSRASASYAR